MKQNPENIISIILIRGLPGSGKSTLAELLSENGRYPVFSVDQFFTDKEGNYNFDPLKNHLAYDECQHKVRMEIKKKTKKIFVDNTFTLGWEMDPYFKMAEENNCRIFVFTLENYHSGTNVHGITKDQISKMAEKYKVKLLP